ncbi:hypothetical protein AUJ84_02545 [Candidatus Pacearchaeota archaeon CG1_02_32_132]|nr:MAG: hypothetical protein AUJ84_02545 [Candidatus Pacearchaeota archaeon CG1_02_32_132]
MKKKKINWKVLIFSFLAVIVVSLFGALFTGSVKSGWYDSVRPNIAPPNWLFGPVWAVLYILIAISLYLALVNSKKDSRWKVGIVFAVNLIANGLWSYLFFGLHQVLFAFSDLILIWATIIVMIIYTWKIDRKAAYLLIPYFLWVSFAGVLNYLVYLSV